MYYRWEMFTEVLRHAIEVSNCDRERYLNLIEENRARQQFYYAISAQDRATLTRCMSEMKQYGSPTLKERLLYLKYLFRG